MGGLRQLPGTAREPQLPQGARQHRAVLGHLRAGDPVDLAYRGGAAQPAPPWRQPVPADLFHPGGHLAHRGRARLDLDLLQGQGRAERHHHHVRRRSGALARLRHGALLGGDRQCLGRHRRGDDHLPRRLAGHSARRLRGRHHRRRQPLPAVPRRHRADAAALDLLPGGTLDHPRLPGLRLRLHPHPDRQWRLQCAHAGVQHLSRGVQLLPHGQCLGPVGSARGHRPRPHPSLFAAQQALGQQG